jgi:hypothetical protein
LYFSPANDEACGGGNVTESTVKGGELLPELAQNQGEIVGIGEDIMADVHGVLVERVAELDEHRVEGKCKERA